MIFTYHRAVNPTLSNHLPKNVCNAVSISLLIAQIEPLDRAIAVLGLPFAARRLFDRVNLGSTSKYHMLALATSRSVPGRGHDSTMELPPYVSRDCLT